jgi:hypothetical protein
MDGARELHLLGGQAAVGVLGQLLSEHKNRVKRRAQLVRHVGQELGLVLRRKRQFASLLFQSAASLLDFLILALHLVVLFGELLSLLRQLLVCLLQFLLLGLQLGSQLLRLLQQAFGLHCRLNRVEHDPDRRGELLEKSQMRRGERAQAGELNHRFHAIFKQHRQHNDVLGNRLEQAGADGCGLLGQITNQHAALF